MTRRRRPILGVSVAAAVFVAAACGKKGNPLPPLRPVPSRITDLTVVRTTDQVELHFTVPASNLDGTEPPAVDRVDIFGQAASAGTPPPTAGRIAADPDHRRAQLAVRPPPADADTPAPTDGTGKPAAGDRATVIDHVAADVSAGSTVIYYTVVPVAGRGRGRSGPPSALATVSLGPLPAPPASIALAYDERQITATWPPGEAGERYRVVRIGTTPGAAPKVLSPEPLSEATFSQAVVFGQRICLAVEALAVSGSATLQGPPSSPACDDPVDHFAPPPPDGLQAVQEGTAVTLIWNRVDAPDLAGYVVLRGEGATADFQPLTRAPITETTYRDTTVRPGTTYSYAVYAVDTAPTPNVSQLSNRQVVTIR